MKYRLGLDLGTASIGAVAMEFNDSGSPLTPIWHAVHIFPEPLENGKAGLVPKKAARRAARQQRRQIERRSRRLRRIAHLAPLIGVDPTQRATAQSQQLTKLRAKAAHERVSLSELLQVLMKVAKRRGYSGGFRHSSEDEKSGEVEGGAKSLMAEIQVMAGEQGIDSPTLGDYLSYRQYVLGKPVKLKAESDDGNLYALRSMVEAEFHQIWSEQEKHHEILKSTRQGHSLRQVFFEAIFFQRPLKSPAPMVGNCNLEPNLPRGPRAQPSYQTFRIEKTIGDLRWGMGRRSMALSLEQKDVIRKVLNNPEKLKTDATVSFSNLYKELEAAGYPKPEGRGLNLERFSREELIGNKTAKQFHKFGLLEPWQHLSENGQIQAINFLADLGSPEQIEADDWYLCFQKSGATGYQPSDMRTFSGELIGFINLLKDNRNFNRLSTMKFDGGRASYSIKALKMLNQWLQYPHWPADWLPEIRQVDEDTAVRVCYPRATRETELRIGCVTPTGNDVVDGALRQLKWVVNRCIQALGIPPNEVIIETARELNASAKVRNDWEMKSKRNQKERKRVSSEIAKSGGIATNNTILRYQLWEEQEERCPYCELKINMTEALNGAATHYEHILPRSLTQVGRKRSELVLAHASCNSEKGDRIPYRVWGDNPGRWAHIVGVSKRFEELGKKNYSKNRPLALAYYRKAKLLTLMDYETEVMTDSSIADFADRQLHQTHWIAKAAIDMMKSLTPNVFASKGMFTAKLRHSWHLNTVIPEVRFEEGLDVLDIEKREINSETFATYRNHWEGKQCEPEARTDRIIEKRIDHRHHLIDALIVSLTSRSLYLKLARQYAEESNAVKHGTKNRIHVGVEPGLSDLRNHAMALVRDSNLTHKPDHNPNGSFYQDTVYTSRYNPDTGDDCLCIRRSIKDLIDPKNEEKTRRTINLIQSESTRELVQNAFDNRRSKGIELSRVFDDPILNPQFNTPIKRVMVYFAMAAPLKSNNAARIQLAKGEKLLINDGYACVEFKVVDSQAIQPRLLTMAEFQSNKKAEKGVVRIFKNDVVMDQKNGKRYLVRQYKNEGPMLLLTPEVDSRGFTECQTKARRKVSGKSLGRLTLLDK